MSACVQVFGRRHDEAIHALRRPASEKRQGTKSREVWHPAVQRVLWGSYVGGDLDGGRGASTRRRACAHAREPGRVQWTSSRSPPTYDPHSTRCTAGCHTSRDFVPWRFSDAGRRSAWIASSCRRPKTYTMADMQVQTLNKPSTSELRRSL